MGRDFFDGTKKSGGFPFWAAFACTFFAFMGAFVMSRQIKTGNEDLKLPCLVLWCFVPVFVFPLVQWNQIRLEKTVDKRGILALLFSAAIFCFAISYRLLLSQTHPHQTPKDFETKDIDATLIGFNVFAALLLFSIALAAESANRVLAREPKIE